MTKKVFAITTQPGIRRDGTTLDGNQYQDGQWVRFQRGRPRKMLGYREITPELHGISRGIFVDNQNTVTRIFNGYNAGVQSILVNKNGVGSAKVDAIFGGYVLTLGSITGGTLYTNGTYTGVALTGGSGYGATANITVSGNTVTAVTIVSAGSAYLVGDVLSATSASIGGTGSGFSVPVATINNSFASNPLQTWQFDQILDSGGDGEDFLVASPVLNLEAIDSVDNQAVLIADISSTTSDYIFSPLRDASTGELIEVSGGVCVIHPYIFVYGNNGLIKNCSAGNPFDWTSADSNENNMASGKIVKGMPVRGGTTSPSGLFWATDSLIRVSYTSTAPFYWRYDIIGSTSILSSNCVVEYDGIYFWIGVDRFLMYNGVIKEVPNAMNQNWFFDNLNYNQRQKVWGTKVPRFGEIWWFYPRGDATECTDVIIYNVRENTWYDVGSAEGARRSAGYFAQVFQFPIMAENIVSNFGVIKEFTGLTAGTSYTNGIYGNVPLINNSLGAIGSGATAIVTVAGNAVTSVELIKGGQNYAVGDELTANVADIGGTGSGFTIEVEVVTDDTSLWQHEFGVDKIKGQNQTAIRSYFETNNLGWVTGNPAQTQPIGDNRWIRLERVEPDFLQQGEMNFYVNGKSYAQGADEISQAYPFEPNTPKIDMREQRREMRVRFESNVVRGDYQMGAVLLSADVGDVRGTAQ